MALTIPMANGSGTLSIGTFSMITRLTQKAIRYYEEKGILLPVRKEMTGYRWYSYEQVPRGLLLRRLSDLGFSIEDIRDVVEMVEKGSDASTMEPIVKRRVRAIEEEVAALEAIRGSLKDFNPQEVFDVKNEEPIVKEIPATRVISKTDKGTYAEVTPRLIGELFSVVMWPQGRNVRVVGPPMAIYHDEEYKEKDATVEMAIPIAGRLEVDESVEIKTIPSMKVMSAIHKGPYDQVGAAWGRLFKYLEQKGIHPAGKARELYLNDPGKTPGSELLTEVQVPI
jgi:effector-binding domain-containing protein